MIRARLLSGFPWNDLGASQWRMTPLIQIASVTGVYGISFLVVWVSARCIPVQALLRHPTTRYVWMSEVALPVIVLMVLFNMGLARFRNAPTPDSSLRVTFIQPAVPQSMIWDTSENTNRFNQLFALTKPHSRTRPSSYSGPRRRCPNSTTPPSPSSPISSNSITWMLFNADDVLDKAQPTTSRPMIFSTLPYCSIHRRIFRQLPQAPARHLRRIQSRVTITCQHF